MSANPGATPSAAQLIDSVHEFWFGAPGSPESFRREWFAKDEAFDAQIRERFGGVVDAALNGAHREWRDSPRGALAYILVLDQFPRNLFRGRPEAFAGDARALESAELALAAGFDARLRPIERMFLYLPLMHSEDLARQERSVALCQQLALDAPDLDNVRFALDHRDVIRRFGRFPQRNAALGRASTPEELAYLADAPRW